MNNSRPVFEKTEWIDHDHFSHQVGLCPHDNSYALLHQENQRQKALILVPISRDKITLILSK